MNWIFLSLLSAFGQALGWAVKKKTLENKGVNNTLGIVSYLSAGIILAILWGAESNLAIPQISARFVFASFVIISLNVLASWAIYRALDKEALSILMPFVALTSLAIVPIEYLLRDIAPTFLQIVGIIIVVSGAIIVSFRKRPSKESYAVIWYFTVAMICYSITSPFMAVAVDESGSGLFSAAVFHLGIALGFLPLVMLTNEKSAVLSLQKIGEWKKVLLLMIIAGAVIALLENGPATVALETAKASEVFALKRTMPFFALILGIFMFQEKLTRKHIFGTIFLVLGSVMVVWFR